MDHNLFWRPIYHHAAGFNQGKDDLLSGLCDPRGRSNYLLLHIRTPARASGIEHIGIVARSHAVDRPAGSSCENNRTNGCAQLCATDVVAVFRSILHTRIRLTTGLSGPLREKESPVPFNRGGTFFCCLLDAGTIPVLPKKPAKNPATNPVPSSMSQHPEIISKLPDAGRLALRQAQGERAVLFIPSWCPSALCPVRKGEGCRTTF